MSKKANPVLIGTFVVCATVIVAMGVLVLGSGKFFSESRKYVLYFDSNLSGLDVGAPVTFRGVRIGEVVDVDLVYDHSDDSLSIPVTIKIERENFSELNAEGDRPSDSLGLHIKRGLRGQLKSQSLVTGKLKVELDYHKGAPETYVAKNTDITEIPTIPGSLDSLTRRLSELPLEDIVRDIRESSKAMAALANSDKMQESLKLLNATLSDGQEMMAEMNKGAAPFRREILLVMEEFGDAARSAQYLMDYLERHPEALIHGKGKE